MYFYRMEEDEYSLEINDFELNVLYVLLDYHAWTFISVILRYILGYSKRLDGVLDRLGSDPGTFIRPYQCAGILHRKCPGSLAGRTTQNCSASDDGIGGLELGGFLHTLPPTFQYGKYNVGIRRGQVKLPPKHHTLVGLQNSIAQNMHPGTDQSGTDD